MSPTWTSLRYLLLVLGLVAAAFLNASGQAGSEPPAPRTAPALPSTTTLSKTYPVITAKGTCPKSAANRKGVANADCKVTISREEFEALVSSLNPKMVKDERRVLAGNYGKALALSLEASRRGLDQDPRLQAQLRYSRLIILANAMSKELYKDALASPEEEGEKYYAGHKSLFERFNFERIYIPLEKHHSQPATSPETTSSSQPNDDLSQREMKELAERMYARAVGGEDFDKLQKEAFKTAEVATDPNIKVEDLRRGDLSEVQNVIFDLDPGKISPLLTDQTGYFIYKMVSKTVPPFETVKPQVMVRMQNDKTAAAVRTIEKLSKAEVNAAYFDKYDPPPPNENEPDLDSD